MSTASVPYLEKTPTGIAGFDEITFGGLPRGRPSLIAGSAGSGKTLFALEFVLRGVEKYQEPGLFVSFEEKPQELAANVASLGFDIEKHERDRRLRVMNIELGAIEFIEAGDFDLDGIFLRLGMAIDDIGARRVALDAVENLFSAFTETRILRAEFRRLMGWLKTKGVTAVVTTERGVDSITRHGLEEYIADCVITLDNRVDDQIATRRIRVVKYRGSRHHGDECPFIVDRRGIAVMSITSAGLNFPVATETISSGIPGIDAMLAGGIYRGSSILVTGTAGTGKSSIAAHMTDSVCRQGEHCLFVTLEESPAQIERNMRSIGIDLARWRDQGLLHFHATRPTSSGLETHLASIAALVQELEPALVVIDPITAFASRSYHHAVKLMLVRAVDLFKARGITSLFTALTSGNTLEESTALGISSLMDVWFLLRNLEAAAERTRGLYVCKARGMAHSNQIREFQLTDDGVRLVDVQLSEEGGILTGSARVMHHKMKASQAQAQIAEEKRRRAALEHRRTVLEAKIAALRAEYEDELRVLDAQLAQDRSRNEAVDRAMSDLADQRGRSDIGQVP